MNIVIIIQKHLEVYGNTVCKDIPAVNNDGDIVDFNEANLTDSFNFKEKKTSQTGGGRTKDLKIMAPLKCLSNFQRILEMP